MPQSNLSDWAEALGCRVAAGCPTYYDDIRQEARIAFWRAQRDYDPKRARGMGEAAFIKQRTRWYLFRELRRYIRWSQHEVYADCLER